MFPSLKNWELFGQGIYGHRKKTQSHNKFAQSHENNSQKIILRNRFWQFRAIPQK